MNLCKTEVELVKLIKRCAALKFNNRCPSFDKHDIERLIAKGDLTSGANVEYILLRYHEELYAEYADLLDGRTCYDIPNVNLDILKLTLENRYFRRHGVYSFVENGGN